MDGFVDWRLNLTPDGTGLTCSRLRCVFRVVFHCTAEDAEELAPTDLIDELDGMPPDKQFCAQFAINALNQALDFWEGKELG